MIPVYENINLNIDSSFNLGLYTHTNSCDTSNWHIHPEYELVYIRNGSGVLRIDSNEIFYFDGAFLFLGPNIPHADFGNKDHEDNLEIVIQFKKEFIYEKLAIFPELSRINNLIEKANQAILFDSATKNEFSKYFKEFKVGQDSLNLINLIRILERLEKIGSYSTILQKDKLIKYKVSEVRRLETIFEFVNEHYAMPIDINTISNKVGLTKNSFCRFFKKVTHKSYVQFVNEFRIRKAIELFNRKQYSVAEVMYKCGYNDATYFSRVFKKYTNQLPSYYAKS